VHAELRLGEGICCSRKRVERLMRQAGVAGIYRRRGHGCTRRDPDATPNDDLVGRQFDPDGPDRLWVMDITEHPTDEGKLFLGAVLDAWSRRTIADHDRSELVVDALQMAIWRRQPPEGQTIAQPGTTRADGTHTAGWSVPSTTRPPPRHDHHIQTVRWNGGSSRGPRARGRGMVKTWDKPTRTSERERPFFDLRSRSVQIS
jgi:transposase InsO family protein